MLMSSLMKGIASASIFSLAGFALGFFDHIWLSALMILVTMLISFWLRLKILRNEMHSQRALFRCYFRGVYLPTIGQA